MGYVARGEVPPIGQLWVENDTNIYPYRTFEVLGYGAQLYIGTTSTSLYTSPDAKNWTLRSLPVSSYWRDVCYGSGTYVVVGSAIDANPNAIITSTDAINWTSRTLPQNIPIKSVCHGNGLFVATCAGGSGTRVMTSPDGITWTSRVTPSDYAWNSIAYGNGIFVAVAGNSSALDAVMTSIDGIAWALRVTPIVRAWNSVTYGNGVFVAVGGNGTTTGIMTSIDGIEWASQFSPVAELRDVAFGSGTFVAVAYGGADVPALRVIASKNGYQWTSVPVTDYYVWTCLTYGNGLFVASGNNAIMTSGAIGDAAPQPDAFSRKLTTDESSTRALNTTYTNTGDSSLLVQATVKCSATIAGGTAYAQGKSDSATPPTTLISGRVGIEGGLLNDTVSALCAFVVAPDANYRIDTTVANGTAVLGSWFEMRF